MKILIFKISSRFVHLSERGKNIVSNIKQTLLHQNTHALLATNECT